ncbi:MAG: hypothetical protein JRE82_05030 [Deltaproteobacteria bacterium]|nr:hypothetical protein [Deltaproteobacteria bacterium]
MDDLRSLRVLWLVTLTLGLAGTMTGCPGDEPFCSEDCEADEDCVDGTCVTVHVGTGGSGGAGGAGGVGGVGGSGGMAGSSGCASATGESLRMLLDWTEYGEGNLNVGATTPNAPTNVIAANYMEDDADLNCTHSGDAPIQGGGATEEMLCNRPMAGTYSIQIDNEEAEDIPFELLVTIDGRDIPIVPAPPNTVAASSKVNATFCLE